MSELKEPIVWLDLETDGVSRTEGTTLEIGIVLTDGLDEHVDEYSIVIYPEPNPQKVWERMPEVVRKMHTDTGLWAECLDSEAGESWAEHEAMSFLDSYGLPVRPLQRGDRSVTWGGKGVAPFDGPWLEHRMPLLHSWLRYWAFDVSPIRRIGALAGVEEPEFFQEGETQHRAVDDARNAWRAARWWRDTIYASKNPGQFPRMEKQVKRATDPHLDMSGQEVWDHIHNDELHTARAPWGNAFIDSFGAERLEVATSVHKWCHREGDTHG